MPKQTIKNRKNQNISILIEENPNAKGLAFVMHGLSGFKEQDHISMFAKVFSDNGYTVVRFDTTNTFGESDGDFEDATITNYYEDLEDIINWAKTQNWYKEPFCLVGHSLGSICISLYSQKHPIEIKALAPISTVVSGKLSVEVESKEELDNWKKTGYSITKSNSIPGLIKKLKWSHIEDRLKYDLLKNVNKLSMPVLMIVGEDDPTTPLKHQKILFDKLSSKKELHVIKGAQHTFRDKSHLDEIYNIFDKWIKNIK